jgi:hypothetical protein
VPDSNSNLTKSVTHYNQTKELTTCFLNKLGPKMKNQLGPEEEHGPVTNLHTKFKATKAWAGYCRSHLGQIQPKTTSTVHHQSTANRESQLNKIVLKRTPKP